MDLNQKPFHATPVLWSTAWFQSLLLPAYECVQCVAVCLSLTVHQEAEVFPHEQKGELGEAHGVVFNDTPAQKQRAETSYLPPVAK